MEGIYPQPDGVEGRPLRARAARVASPARVTAFPAIPNARLILPGDADYADYLKLHNRFNNQPVARRILCSSTQAVSDSIKWVKNNGLKLAVRSGGHCYEGFSQSSAVVIDTRGMALVTVDAAAKTVSVSAGAPLGKVYEKVAAQGFAFAAGSCPTVGVPGHTLGGGQGLLGRRYGLACDNLIAVRTVDANGTIRECDASNHPDFYWAARGGGGGSFFIATRFTFRIHTLATVRTFKVEWRFPNTSAGRANGRAVFNAWHTWAPQASRATTAIMRVSKDGNGRLLLSVIGQSTASTANVTSELNTHLIVKTPTLALTVSSSSFLDAVKKYSGGFAWQMSDYKTVFMNAKSDVVTSPLPAAAIDVMIQQVLSLPAGGIALLCDPYGGAISDMGFADTAFPHRGGSTYIIQYYASWLDSALTTAKRAGISKVYNALHPYCSGGAYVNYPDIELPNPGFASAYWGSNLPRLMQIKTAIDPGDFFKHGQSVPLS